MWDWLSEILSGIGDWGGQGIEAGVDYGLGEAASSIANTITPELDLWNSFLSSGAAGGPGMDMFGAVGPTASSAIGSMGGEGAIGGLGSMVGGSGFGDEIWDVAKSAGKGLLKGALPAAGAMGIGMLKPKPKMPSYDFPNLSSVGQSPSIPPYTPPPGANWSPLLRNQPKVKNSSGLRIGV